jgi:glutathione S-transferase
MRRNSAAGPAGAGWNRIAAAWGDHEIGPASAFHPTLTEEQRLSRKIAQVAPKRGSREQMLTLFHNSFCPHSRFVRLALAEHGVDVRLVEERPWDRRTDFLLMNPAGTTPVLVEEGHPPVPGAAIVAEFLDEACGGDLGERRLLPRSGGARVEVRRLMSWFNDKFFAEVSGPLTAERFYKRHMPRDAGGGSPDTEALRAARHNIRYHLAYIGWLVRARDWLAGDRLSYADLAAAAHLSAADYLGDVPWSEDEAAKNWYARVKSRPSFRPILAETIGGIPPSPTYADLDF